jgi:hypothetical protein
MQCIGAAVGRAPAGPFVPGPRPFICQVDQHGSIDPRTYVAPDGTTYMLFKSDDNAPDLATPTNIYSQPLSASGLQLLAGPTRIFGPDQRWQGNLVEAPDMVAVDGTTWLFYSGNWFNEPDYAIGFARCTGPLGPCADVTTHPLLASNFQGRGPGEESLFENGQGIFMLYTPFLYNSFGYSAPRPVLMVRLGFGPFGPYLGSPGPTVAPPLAPPVVPPVAAPSPAAAPGTSGRPTSTPRSLSAGGQPSSGVT